jgi:hypothetical protein
VVGQVGRAIAGDCQVCGLQAGGGFSGSCHDVVTFGASWGWVKGEKHIQLAASFFCGSDTSVHFAYGLAKLDHA